MLSPAYLRNAAEPVVDLFSQVEQDISADIARRIVKAGYVTYTAQYQLEKAQEIGLLQGDVSKILTASTGKSKKEIEKMTKEAGAQSLKFDDSIYRKAGMNPPPLEHSPVVSALLLQGVEKTGALIDNFTKTAATTSTRAFSSALDRCYLQILSGAFDRNTAINLAVRDLATKGIEKVAYPSGATSSMESAVRRAVTTGLNQSVSKLQLARAEDMGCELVETTSHAGARPTHAEWQGKVFCIKGHHKSYGDFYRETGYGEGDGLCGWNCYHSFFPYFEGLSLKTFVRDPSMEYLGKENDQMYEEQQKQRYYERRIRAAKKECAVYSAAFDEATDPELKAAMQKQLLNSSEKLRSREATLNSFLAQTGRTKDPSRVVVGGWNRNEMTTSKTKIAREAKEVVAAPVKDYNALVKDLYTKDYFTASKEATRMLRELPVGSTITTKGVIYTKTGEDEISKIVNGEKKSSEGINSFMGALDLTNAKNAPIIEAVGSTAEVAAEKTAATATEKVVEKAADVQHKKLEDKIKDLKEKFDNYKYDPSTESYEKQLELVKKAGHEFVGDLKKEIEKVNNSYEKEIDEIFLKLSKVPDLSPEARKLDERLMKIYAERDAKKKELCWKTVSSIRKCGADEKVLANKVIAKKGKTKAETVANEKMAELVRSTMQKYPSEWVKNTLPNGCIEVLSTDRGYCQGTTLAISGKGIKAERTAFHEIAHRFEKIPRIRKLEAMYYDERTKGEKLVKLKDVVKGAKYRDDEVTKVDNWLRPYMGKWYGGNGFELISMGFERAMTGDMEIMKDPDYASFIFGLLMLA